ncbi:hypothetical protein ZIOFF_040827 [Zingiber officinale]|uniref:Disease resistance N-terminal domain-containing protein n=1 Tax=Zingiber officinale TaxID=94328 RepID=A0A8J5KYA5_ZINOF|nr:hypothetical protein ZIOFF_040827 [Zingiber officinale]
MESTAAKLVMENLGELVSSDVAGILNVDAEVKSLTETLALIQSFLRDADQKPRYAQSYSLQEWMRQIRNLAFEMEDLVDEYAVQLGRASASDGRMSSLQRLGAFPSRILTRRLLTSRLQDIRARFQYVCKQASQLEEDIVGFDEDTKYIKRQVFDISLTARVVLSVVGTGGFQRTPAVTTPGAKFLRVYLDLQKLLIEHLPKEIGDLILLRLEKDEDIAMLASLADLQILRLRSDAFVGRVLVFPKGGFPRLQEIELYRLSTLEQWEVGDGAMPFLRELRLWNCINMRMLLLPEGLVRLTELNQIDIR